MKHLLILLTLLSSAFAWGTAFASGPAPQSKAESAFTELMRRNGLNYLYTSGLLSDINVREPDVSLPVEKALDIMFRGTSVIWRRSGNNIILSRRPKQHKPAKTIPDTKSNPEEPEAEMLEEVTVFGNLNRTLTMDAAAIGSLTLSNKEILSTPVIFGEADVIKTLQLEPGVSAGVEGMAGMYVHGGNVDENLYMLDNIPLYQVNHFGGLFSAFNTDALRSVDFYKSSVPSRYNGRLSSFMDIRTKDGAMQGHHGSFRLGLTSGAFNIDGPLWKGHTTYSVALRRSWYDLLTIPAFAIANKLSKDENYTLGYAFTDLNLKIKHQFSDRTTAHALFYFGEDYLRVSQSPDDDVAYSVTETYKNHLRWGNLVASVGVNHAFASTLNGEFTAAFTRYASRLQHDAESGANIHDEISTIVKDRLRSDNNIHDIILKADFGWHPAESHNIDFGASATNHNYLPSSTSRTITSAAVTTETFDRNSRYHAFEASAYFNGDWRISDFLRINYGLNSSLFSISSNHHYNLSPRFSFRFSPSSGWAFKAGYTHTVQYVHQLMQSAISLPTDQWVPIVGTQKPQTAYKIFAGAYHTTQSGYTFSGEAYWKRMKNLLEYVDEYYLLPPETDWTDKLSTGKGNAKGIDFKISKDSGKITGHISYSLLWANRCYPNRNNGRPYPARFDNRHKINVLANWKINGKWEVSASWTGMSGNRFTLPTQVWEDPELGPWHYDMLLQTDINNYRLPFYHRMDLSFRRNTRRGYWNFSLYNAYCNMNTIAIRRDYSDSYIYDPSTGQVTVKPVFQKIKLIPIIPSVSYTWIF